MRPDLDKLQGTWDVVALEIEGARMDEGVFRGSRIVVKGDSFSTISMGATYSGKIRLNASASPAKLDLMFEEGPSAGMIQRGIYELSGDTLRVCFSTPGKERPSQLATKAGEGRTLAVWKRDREK